MSLSFTSRETQTRMLRFTVPLQHHARRRLPTFQLIFVHVIESLVFVPVRSHMMIDETVKLLVGLVVPVDYCLSNFFTIQLVT
ncbi:unnamed protein product [Linum trigynum]|uniref:Uncharacterized protein n=1 Tax=Linum trigynum TaxID=586398 RepID=A0AAV2E0U4_9ROSI